MQSNATNLIFMKPEYKTTAYTYQTMQSNATNLIFMKPEYKTTAYTYQTMQTNATNLIFMKPEYKTTAYTYQTGFSVGVTNDLLTFMPFKLLTRKEGVVNVRKRSGML
jgi:hypothetical protein